MEFFLFYKNIVVMKSPFKTFSLMHFILLLGLGILICICISKYKTLTSHDKRKVQIYLAKYFFFEEVIYTLWLLWQCKSGVLYEILPLQLCSVCIYIAISAVYLKRRELRFFSSTIGLLAGIVALIYPANLSGLYPEFSYRTLNFFVLHGALVLFGLMQLQEDSILTYKNASRSAFLLSLLVLIAFIANIIWKTEYMFLGVPPTIHIIYSVYQYTGFILFIPTVLLFLTSIQYAIVFVYQSISRYTKKTNPLT